MEVITCVVGEIQTNCYILAEGKDCFIVDPGFDAKDIITTIEERHLKPQFIINTHGHYDHMGDNKVISDHFSIPVYCHESEVRMLTDAQINFSMMLGVKKESPAPQKAFKDGDTFSFVGSTWTIMHTPGHTQGSMIFYNNDNKIMFTGDTLFNEDFGRTDLPGGSEEQLKTSLRRIAALPGDFTIYPGHADSALLSDQRPVIDHYCRD